MNRLRFKPGCRDESHLLSLRGWGVYSGGELAAAPPMLVGSSGRINKKLGILLT
ncbi:MAG: hypothetical protein VYA84_13405 [Planctomycetota bacterium]|nr:hypothetical protein [Planctomycetota bacterium]